MRHFSALKCRTQFYKQVQVFLYNLLNFMKFTFVNVHGEWIQYITWTTEAAYFPSFIRYSDAAPAIKRRCEFVLPQGHTLGTREGRHRRQMTEKL